jgi:hypothetical protein
MFIDKEATASRVGKNRSKGWVLKKQVESFVDIIEDSHRREFRTADCKKKSFGGIGNDFWKMTY